MAKFGSSSIAVLVADGVSLLPLKAKDIASEYEAMQDNTTGLGDSWPEHTPTGMQSAALSLGEAFYDTDTAGVHDSFKDAADGRTARVLCYVLEGDTIGEPFVGHTGALSVKYGVMAKVGGLTKAKVEYLCSGAREEGIILQNTAVKTADWNTEGASSVDNGASTASGGSGYLQVSAYSGFTNLIGKIRHSADDVTYADLLTFTTVTAIGAERVTVSGTVNRHLAFDGNVTGTGSVTVFAGFYRAS
jgi:hypothetical protein